MYITRYIVKFYRFHIFGLIAFFLRICYNFRMKTENELKQIVANNITLYRKVNNLTQLQLAEKLNYSDKAISKWERGESIPDIYILANIADLFGITLNDLVEKQTEPKVKRIKNNQKMVIALSVGLLWFISIALFAILEMTNVNFNNWIVFVYALPVSAIVLIVFSMIYNYRILLFFAVSSLYYTIPLSVCLELNFKHKSLALFLLSLPIQVLTILWFNRKKHHMKKK